MLMRALAPWLSALLLMATGGCLSYPDAPEEPMTGHDRQSLYAPHERDDRFFNPWREFDVGPGKLLRAALTRNPFDTSHEPQIPRVTNDGRELSGPQASARMTWAGHASFIIHDGADVVLTDPHFSERALVVRRQQPPGVPVTAIPGDAFAVISHNHYDHLDSDTVKALPDTVQWFVPKGLKPWFLDRGRNNVIELDWWQSAERGRWTVTCLPMQHWSRRFGQETNTTLWCAWLLDSGERRYLFVGDSGYFHGFAEIGRRFSPIDVAILPIGAYEPRWFMRYQHMNPAEAYQAFQDLGARYLLPSHWGTFDLSHEPLDAPPQALMRAVAEAGGDAERVKVLAVGEGWHLPPVAPKARAVE